MAHRGEDDEADEHPGGACHERLAAAVVFDYVEAVKGRAEVDSVLWYMSIVIERWNEAGLTKII